jgi:hypothetical protein
MYPTRAEANAVMLRNNAIKPSSFEGGAMSSLKITSEMATIPRMPAARRTSIGVRARKVFIGDL